MLPTLVLMLVLACMPCLCADPVIDWSSVEEVASHVSRTTLVGMQQLWKQHAGSMDAQGKAFAQQVYSLHSQTMKVCEPRPQ